jgi:hypothetical protein
MAGDIKFSGAPPGAAVAVADQFMAIQGGAVVRLTAQQVLDLVGDALGNRSIAAQSPAAATLTYITGSDIAVPPAGLRVGTQFRWIFEVSKTAAGTAARSFFLKIGTLGTTADATILTFTSTSAPTAAVDEGRIEIIVTIRAIGAAAGTAKGSLELKHNGNTVGLASVPVHIISPAVSATFNSTTAGLKVGIAVTTGAAEVLTFQQVFAEAKQL